MDFHGKYLHGGLGHFPWNSMEKVAMEFHGGLGHQFKWNSMEFLHRYFPWRIRTFSMKFHGKVPCKKLLYRLYSMDLQGVSWNSQELEIGITNELNGIHNRFWSTAIYWISSVFIINLF